MTTLDLGVLRAFADIDDAPFNSKYTRLVGRMRSLGGEAEKSAAGVSRLDESLATTAASADKAGAALSRVQATQRRSTATSAQAAKATNDQAAAQERVNAVLAQYAGESRQVQAAALRLVAAQERLNTLQESGVATTRQLAAAQASLITSQRSLARAQEIAGTASLTAAGRISRAGGTMTSVGRSLMRTWGLAGGVIAAVSIKSATDFSTAMRRIQTQAGGSAHDVQVLSKQVLDLAQTAQHGPVELANALYHLKSVGMDNADAMRALKQGTDLANVSGAHLEDTVNALAGAWRTGIRGATSFHQAVATVNAVVGAGNMRVQDLNAALGTGILPTAKTFGLTFKDVGSALALFTDEGMSADSAATRLRMSISLLGAPSMAAEKQLNQIHLTGLQLAQDMRQPNGLITAIGDLKSHLDASGKSAAEQSQLLSHAFGGGRSSSAILSMINNYDVLVGKQQQVTAGMDKYNAAVKAQQQTPGAQFANLSANLQRAAVILGDDLLPSVTTLTRDVTGAVQWFERLPAPVKELAGDLAKALIFAGPLLFTLGKLSTPIAGIMRLAAGLRGVAVAEGEAATGSYLMGARIRSAFTAISTAVRNPSAAITTMATNTNRLGAALGGVGIGLGVGMLTRHASGATKALSSLGAAAGGAAVGFAMGGPLGAAIGGLGAGLTSLATQFLGNGDAAAKAAAKAAAFQHQVDGLTQSIQQDNGVVAANTQAYIANALMHSGAADAAQKLGVSLHDLQLAASGNIPAQNRVNAAHDRWIGIASRETAATQRVIDSRGVLTAAQKRQQAQLAMGYALWGKVTGAIGGNNQAIDAAIHRLTMHAQLLHGDAAANRDVTSSTGVTTDALKQQSTALQQVYAAMTRVQSAALANAQSEDQFLESVRSTAKQLRGNSGELDTNTAKGLANRDALLNSMQAALSYKDAQEKAGVSTRQATLNLADNVQQLLRSAIQAGANKQAVDRLARSMHVLPRDIRTQITLANEARIEADFVGIQQKINQIVGNHVITLTVVQQGGPGGGDIWAHGGASLPGRAGGGSVPEGLSWVGEGGAGARPELLSKRGNDVQVVSHPEAVAFAKSAGIVVPGFAKGTSGSLVSLASRYSDWDPRVMAAIAMAESGGRAAAHNYNLGTGDNSYGLWQINMLGSMGPARRAEFGIRSNAALYNPATNVLAAHDIWRDQGYGAWTTYTSGAYQQYLGDGGTIHGGGSGSGTHLTPEQRRHRRHMRIYGAVHQAQAAFESQQHPNRIIRQGNQWYVGGQSYGSHPEAVEALREQRITNQAQASRSFAHNLRAFGHATDTARDANAAFRPLLTALRRDGLDGHDLAGLEKNQRRMDALIRWHNKAVALTQKDHAAWVKAVQHMHQEQRAFAQAGRSGFDITTAGQDANGRFSAGRLVARQSQYLNVLRRLYPAFHKIVPMFDKTATGRAMLRQLASEDPTQALPEVLALANSPRLDKLLLRGQTQEQRLTDQFGGYLSRKLDLGGVQSKHAQFVEDRKAERRTEKAIDHLADRLEHALVHAYDKASPDGATFRLEWNGHGLARAVRIEEKRLNHHRHMKKKTS